MEPDMPHVVGCIVALDLVLEGGGQPAVLDDGFVVELRSGNPHNLHFSFFVSQTNMYLLMPQLCCDFNLSYLD